MYDGAPFVDEWKPLPPRLHDQRTLERVGLATRRRRRGEVPRRSTAVPRGDGERPSTDGLPDRGPRRR